jgi:hypothetical protein
MGTHPHSSRSLGPRRHLATLLAILLLAAMPFAAVAQDFKDRPEEGEPGSEEPPSGNDEFEDAGITGETSYESPQFGYTVEWDTDWEVDTGADEPVLTDESRRYDSLNLVWDGPGRAIAFLTINGTDAPTGGPDAEVRRWTDEDYLEDIWDPDEFAVEVLLDDDSRRSGAVLLLVENTEENYTFVAMNQVIDLGSTNLYVFFSMSDRDVEEAFTALDAEINLDGSPLDLQFTVEEIVEAVEGP